MSTRDLSVPTLLLICLVSSGCATTGDDTASAHDNMDAVLWLQTSTEYAAATTSTYAAATAALRKVAAEAAGTNGMAVVLDVDETVLDNSPYQAQLVFDDAVYEGGTWDEWIALRAAPAVPGVVEFIRTSQSLGFHVAFITNRACRTRANTTDECPQKEDTRVNLEDVGIDMRGAALFLRGDRPSSECRGLLTAPEQADGKWSSDKTSRRECVRRDREIVMLFGDQLGDFTETHESGRDAAAAYSEHWGKTWFMLPNPTYGDWRPGDTPEKRTRMRGLD